MKNVILFLILAMIFIQGYYVVSEFRIGLALLSLLFYMIAMFFYLNDKKEEEKELK